MKNWLKENWFKVGIIAILFCGLMIYANRGGSFFGQLSTGLSKEIEVKPKVGSEDLSLSQYKPEFKAIPIEMKEKCSKLYNQFEKDQTSSDYFLKDGSTRTEVKVVYSPILDTCIGASTERTRYITNGTWTESESREIIDIFTQKTLNSSYSIDLKKADAAELSAFFQREIAFETFLFYVSGGQIGRDDSSTWNISIPQSYLYDVLVKPFKEYLGTTRN